MTGGGILLLYHAEIPRESKNDLFFPKLKKLSASIVAAFDMTMTIKKVHSTDYPLQRLFKYTKFSVLLVERFQSQEF